MRVGGVYEKADVEREFGLAAEGDNLLWNAIFKYLEGLLIEAGNELAGRVVDAEGERYEVDFRMKDSLLSAAAERSEEQE